MRAAPARSASDTWTAFAASDLRFVQYAGRYRANGNLRNIVSAHAVLASRTVDKNSGRGAHGFWLLGKDRNLFHQHPYPHDVPPLLRRELAPLADTGSVVCMIGFNNFRSDELPIDAIARVAAKNFLGAIWNKRMIVQIEDEVSGGKESVTADRLGSILKRQRHRKHAEQGGGWLSGEQGFRAWQTLNEGRELRFSEEGVTAWFRPLGDNPRTRSRVQLFRNGMWITNTADCLRPADFNGFKPFDAVLEIGSGIVGSLIRAAEGPEHRGLERRRLGKLGRKRLLKLLQALRTKLQEEAGQREESEEFTPSGFAMFRGDAERLAEAVPAYRPRPRPTLEPDHDQTRDPKPLPNRAVPADPWTQGREKNVGGHRLDPIRRSQVGAFRGVARSVQSLTNRVSSTDFGFFGDHSRGQTPTYSCGFGFHLVRTKPASIRSGQNGFISRNFITMGQYAGRTRMTSKLRFHKGMKRSPSYYENSSPMRMRSKWMS